NSLIWGENLENIAVTGKGMINGRTLHVKNLELAPWEDPQWADKDNWDDYPDQDAFKIGNKAIAFKECNTVTIKDITIFLGGHYTIMPVGCDGLFIDNVTVDTRRDGIDITCCRNFVVRNTRVNAENDDALCLKASLALGKRVLCENGYIFDCYVSGYRAGSFLNGKKLPLKRDFLLGNGRIKFGTESEGGFRNIRIENCKFEHCYGLAIEEVDGGMIENIYVDGIEMKQVRQYGIYITTGIRYRNKDAPGWMVSKVKDVTIRNVTIEDCSVESGIQLHGLRDEPLENIILENITLVTEGGGSLSDVKMTPNELGRGYPEPKRLGRMPAYGLYARHVANSTFKNIQFTTKQADKRPCIVLVNTDDITLDDIVIEGNEGITQLELRKDAEMPMLIDSPRLEL
ncbi:MAG: right-handed parallel beta-helix repeat-containing protein, partial [Verrucomicrobiota bacterium]